jgi:hypothetical protein
VEYCTCGAKTVEGARFCHKCGRPLSDELAVVESSAVTPEPSVTAASTEPNLADISFRNMIAVRVGFLAAGIAIFATQIMALFRSVPLQLLSFVALSLASGAFTVWLYRRRTGHLVSVQGGARLGWITGVFSFMIVVVVTAVSILAVGPDNLLDAFRQSQRGLPEQREIEEALSNPGLLAVAMALGLAASFAVYTVSASLGGAIGAKLLGSRSGDTA